MADLEQMGSIDYLLIEAPGKEINGELVPPILDLVDRRLVRILDVLVIVKRGEGDFEALTTSDLETAGLGDIGALSGASSGLLDADDASKAAGVMQENSLGLLLVYENLWSRDFGIAARQAGGQLIAYGHIPTQALVAALED